MSSKKNTIGQEGSGATGAGAGAAGGDGTATNAPSPHLVDGLPKQARQGNDHALLLHCVSEACPKGGKNCRRYAPEAGPDRGIRFALIIINIRIPAATTAAMGRAKMGGGVNIVAERASGFGGITVVEKCSAGEWVFHAAHIAFLGVCHHLPSALHQLVVLAHDDTARETSPPLRLRAVSDGRGCCARIDELVHATVAHVSKHMPTADRLTIATFFFDEAGKRRKSKCRLSAVYAYRVVGNRMALVRVRAKEDLDGIAALLGPPNVSMVMFEYDEAAAPSCGCDRRRCACDGGMESGPSTSGR